MTTEEFSTEFDVLYNNIASNLAPGLDLYEKSIFLTRALNMIVKNYFNPANNTELEGFDLTPKRLIDFSSLIMSVELDPITPVEGSDFISQFDPRTTVFEFPVKPLMVINEYAELDNGKIVVGLPAPYSTYTTLMSKPYQYPPKGLVWRLMMTGTEGSGSGDYTGRTFEVLADRNLTVSNYFVRFVKLPKPIILDDLDTAPESTDPGYATWTPALSIEGEYEKTECELDAELHWEILLKAVELATAVYKLGSPASDAEPLLAKEKANLRQLLRQ